MEIYHNPRCKKSRDTLKIIEDSGKKVLIKKYLENTPSKEELKGILNKLNITAENLLRKNEIIFKENFKGKNLSEDEWIEVMIKYPKLIERPIVVQGNRAIIGRPPINVKELL